MQQRAIQRTLVFIFNITEKGGIALILALLFSATAAKAAEYGPRTLDRDRGTPEVVVEKFFHRTRADRYDLVIVNGTPDGNHRVSSAWVWLNGMLAVEPADFSRRVASIRKTVQLQEGENEIAVQLASAPGGRIIVAISAVLGQAGGTIFVPDGPSFTIPAGALAADVDVDLRPVSQEQIGVPLPGGYTFVGAAALDLGGSTLAMEGDLSLPYSGDLRGRPILAKVLPLGPAPRLALVDTASAGDGRLRTNSPPFPGVRAGGTYLFLEMPSELGIVGSYVRDPSGTLMPGALVQIVPRTIPADTPSELITSSEDSMFTFVGQAAEDGFASVPGIVPGSSVGLLVFHDDGSGQIGLGLSVVDTPFDIALGGLLGAWDALIGRLVDANNLPPLPPVCPCATPLTVVPASLPDGPTPFSPGDSRQLKVWCGVIGDVTVTSPSFWSAFSSPLAPLSGPTWNVTWYTTVPAAQRAIAVSDGLVTGQEPGAAGAIASLLVLSLSRSGPSLCLARGGANVVVSCPANAPQWNAATRRCEVPLQLNVAGAGSGSITTNPNGANCGTQCFSFSPNSTVQLTAVPDTGSSFDHWTGDCSGTSPTTSLLLTQSASCTAVFALASRLFVSLDTSWATSGTVTSAPAGIDCGSQCSAAFAPGTTVTLTAIPGSSSSGPAVFESWSGDCAGTALTTTVVMDGGDKTCTASFRAPQIYLTGTACRLTSITERPNGTRHDYSGTVDIDVAGFARGPTGGSVRVSVWFEQSIYGLYWPPVSAWFGEPVSWTLPPHSFAVSRMNIPFEIRYIQWQIVAPTVRISLHDASGRELRWMWDKRQVSCRP